tara:strand:- start:1143 stop:1508 length:366 start_codon:yes stop_codon:yes gene_type:complete
MPVNRISEKALTKLVQEQIEEDALCVIKFYSNECDYCTALHDYYVDIAEANEDESVHFFAFNVADSGNLDSLIKINGVPTIISVKTGLLKPRIRILADPDPPNKQTWYYSKDIQQFIDKEK